MSQRLTRKDIKRDEFAEAVQSGVYYVGSHMRTLILGAVAVIAVALLGVGIYLWLDSRSTRANEQLADAILVFRAPVVEVDADPDDETNPSFPDEASRRQRARELLTELQESMGGTDAGKTARLYLARLAVEEGDLEQARQLWQSYLDGGADGMLASEVTHNLVALDREQGKSEEVVSQLEAMLTAEDSVLPGDVVLYELASAYEDVGRGDDARATYERLVEEYPSSGYAAEAQQRASALGGGVDLARAGS